MLNTHQTVLGISPGTRSVGLAVMRDCELKEWRVKTFKGAWTYGKLKDTLFALIKHIEEQEIKIIALKKPDVLRSSEGLDRLVSEITVWAKMNRIKVVSYSLHEMKRHFSPKENISKEKMIKEIVIVHPELFLEYNKEQRNRNQYYTKVFEAIALAKCCSQSLPLKSYSKK